MRWRFRLPWRPVRKRPYEAPAIYAGTPMNGERHGRTFSMSWWCLEDITTKEGCQKHLDRLATTWKRGLVEHVRREGATYWGIEELDFYKTPPTG